MSVISFTNEITQRQCIIEELQAKIQSMREEIESFLHLETLVKNLFEQSTLVYSTMKEHCPDKLPAVGITLCQDWGIDREQVTPVPPSEATDTAKNESDMKEEELSPETDDSLPHLPLTFSDNNPPSNFAVGDTVRYRGERYTIESISVKEKVARITNDRTTRAAFFSLLEKIDEENSSQAPPEVTISEDTAEEPPPTATISEDGEEQEQPTPTPVDTTSSPTSEDPPFSPGDAVIIRSNYLNGRYRGKRGTIVNYIGLGAAFVDVGDSKPIRLHCKYLELINEDS